jgi:hypothetical protein
MITTEKLRKNCMLLVNFKKTAHIV